MHLSGTKPLRVVLPRGAMIEYWVARPEALRWAWVPTRCATIGSSTVWRTVATLLRHLEVVAHRNQLLTNRMDSLVNQTIDTRHRSVDLGLADLELVPMRLGRSMRR